MALGPKEEKECSIMAKVWYVHRGDRSTGKLFGGRPRCEGVSLVQLEELFGAMQWKYLGEAPPRFENDAPHLIRDPEFVVVEADQRDIQSRNSQPGTRLRKLSKPGFYIISGLRPQDAEPILTREGLPAPKEE